jgi:tripartite-type tricarboxylate transporter receptor subunit TctC
MRTTRRKMMMAAMALPLASSGAALAETFPSHTIKIIVAAGPGTGIDVVTRSLADALGRRLHNPVVVENRGGAGGLIGYGSVAKSPADGYTLIMAGIPLYLTALLSEVQPPPFDPVADFTPIARVARVSQAIVVSAESPYRTMQQLVQAMQQQPGEITYSSQGVGSTAHICMVAFNEMSNTKARHVAYRDTGVAVTDVAANRVTLTCQGPASVLSLVQAGRLRALAVTGTKRLDAFPNVPTVAESGVPGFEISSFITLMAPAHIPAAVQQLLSEEVTRIAQTPQFLEQLKAPVMYSDVADYRKVLAETAAEAARWKRFADLIRPVPGASAAHS